MKRLISIYFCILVLFLVMIAILRESNEEILKYGNMEEKFCTTFYIPDLDEVIKPDVFFDIISETSKKTSCNIIKTRLIDGDRKGSYELIKYIFVNNENSYYINELSSNADNFLNADDTRDYKSRKFISTKLTENEKQIGTIDSKMIHSDVTICTFSTLFDYMKSDGLFYVDLNDNCSRDEFFRVLAHEIKDIAGINLDEEIFRNKNNNIGVPYDDLTIYYTFFLFMSACYILLMIYYVLRKRRNISIMKLMGIRDRYIWKDLFFITLISGLIFEFICLFIMKVVGYDKIALLDMSMGMIGLLLIISLFSVVIFLLLGKKFDIYLALKGKRFLKGIIALNIIAEMVCIFFTLYTGAGIYTDVVSLIKGAKVYKNWNIESKYGVFYPLYNGDDLTEIDELKRDKAIAGDLYKILNKNGALFIDASEYEEGFSNLNLSTSEAAYQKSIAVNPNYLDRFPIYDERGEKIKINENETELMLLIPEKYKQYEDEIIEYYSSVQESAGDIDREYYENNDENLNKQKTRVIWIKQNQNIYPLNPDLDFEENEINNTIIVVYTESNSYISQRIGILGKGNGDPLKIKLNGSSQDTYEDIEDILERLSLKDNLKAIVSISNVHDEFMTTIKKNIIIALRLTLFLLIFIIYIAYQSVYLLFEKNKKKYVVQSMFGVKKIKTYRNIFVLTIITVIATAIMYSFLIKYGGLLCIVISSVGLICIKLVVSYFCLNRSLRLKRLEILKGD